MAGIDLSAQAIKGTVRRVKSVKSVERGKKMGMALGKRMSPEEHREAARTIRQAEQVLDGLLQELLKTYGARSRVGRIAEHLYASGRRGGLDDLRCRLNDAWCDEGHPRTGMRSPYCGRQDDGWHGDAGKAVH